MQGTIFKAVMRHGGNRLVDLAHGKLHPGDPSRPIKRPTLLGALAGAAVVRIATRSVPGAIVVGGGWLAKTMYDRRRAKRGKTPEPADQSTPKA